MLVDLDLLVLPDSVWFGLDPLDGSLGSSASTGSDERDSWPPDDLQSSSSFPGNRWRLPVEL